MLINTQVSKNIIKYLKLKYFISEKPFWISEPKDVAVFVHDDVTLRCEARGIPDPYVSWFVNGIPIEGRLQELVVFEGRESAQRQIS